MSIGTSFIVEAISFIVIPMLLVTFIYRKVDKKGLKTKKIVDKYPIIKKRRTAIQTFGVFAVAIVFGALFLIAYKIVEYPLWVFYIFFTICGVFAGYVNGLSLTLITTDVNRDDN